MTIPDYIAFGVLIVLFVVNVAMALADPCITANWGVSRAMKQLSGLRGGPFRSAASQERLKWIGTQALKDPSSQRRSYELAANPFIANVGTRQIPLPLSGEGETSSDIP